MKGSKEMKKTLSRNEIPEPTLSPRKLKPISSAKFTILSGDSSQDIQVGDNVRHNRFGVGKVIALDGSDPDNVKAKIKFVHEKDEKNLILKFAKLEKLYIFIIFAFLIGADWFRQQDQWVDKHAENRSAISLIPCYKILTGNEEYALAA